MLVKTVAMICLPVLLPLSLFYSVCPIPALSRSWGIYSQLSCLPRADSLNFLDVEFEERRNHWFTISQVLPKWRDLWLMWHIIGEFSIFRLHRQTKLDIWSPSQVLEYKLNYHKVKTGCPMRNHLDIVGIREATFANDRECCQLVERSHMWV